MKNIFTLGTLTAAALLSACATNPTPPPELLSARSAVRNAETDAQVLALAPLDLKRATDSLTRANALFGKGESLAEVESAAYVASRQAETAIAVATAKSREDAIKTSEADRERARADARSADARRAQAQTVVAQNQAAAAQDQAATARLQAGDAEARAKADRERASVAQASANDAQLQAAALQLELADLKARPTERGMLVTLGDVLFEFGRADIKPTAQTALRRLADYLQAKPERRVLIEGHTDSVGGDIANLKLSEQRAEAVALALAGMGVAPGRVIYRGYGERYPVADNGTDTSRALNRRVEVYISDSDQPVRFRG